MARFNRNVKTCILCLLIFSAIIMEADAVSCCLKYSRLGIRCQKLKGYDIQDINGGCDIPAIVFHTLSGGKICADPNQTWTQRRVSCLKMRAEEMKTVRLSMNQPI